ncbi:MAG: hypothetical protein K6T80_00355 [Firmicutes bacterium]|nr:hypothetical protein [Bacillota bacterium]
MDSEDNYKLYTKSLIIISILQTIAYALLYMILSHLNPHTFHNLTQENNFIDFWYFSVVIFTTTGFGDIYPLTTTGRFFVATELIAGITLLISIIYCNTKLIVSARKKPK